MLSRVAENLYWTARYIERAENTARLVNVHGHLLLDLPRRIKVGWEPLIQITGNEEVFAAHYRNADERNVVKFMIADRHNPGSILSCLAQARENLRTTRDVIPRECWEQVNDLYLFAKAEAGRSVSRRGRFDFLKRIIGGAQQITGLLAGTMSHDYGYDFIRIGRNLERADMTTRIVDVRSAHLLGEHAAGLSPFDNIQWMGVLKSLTAYQMYRQHVRVRVGAADVQRFVLQNREFPRSVLHCLSEVEGCIQRLPRNEAPLRSLAHLLRVVRGVDAGALGLEELHAFIDDLQIGVGVVHEQLSQTYFAMQPLPQRQSAAATG